MISKISLQRGLTEVKGIWSLYVKLQKFNTFEEGTSCHMSGVWTHQEKMVSISF